MLVYNNSVGKPSTRVWADQQKNLETLYLVHRSVAMEMASTDEGRAYSSLVLTKRL